MRACLLLVVLALVGCGKEPPSPWDGVQRGSPVPNPNALPVPAKRLTLAQAREKIVEKMTREQVKSLLGPPSDTFEGEWGGNRFHSDEWRYRNQEVIWDEAAEKPYRFIRVVFLKGSDRAAVEVATR